MSRSIRGVTTRPKLPSSIEDTLTRPLRKQWDNVMAGFDRWETAVRDATILDTAARQAPALDAAAAREAVREGKPIPDSTVVAATDAAERKAREASALEDLANQQEAEFMAALIADRDHIAGESRTRLIAALTDADKALTAARDAVDRAATASAAWRWARSDDPGMHLPGARVLNVSMAGVDQEAKVFIDAVARRLAQENPADVEATEARLEAEWAAARGAYAQDGLLRDRAAHAYGM